MCGCLVDRIDVRVPAAEVFEMLRFVIVRRSFGLRATEDFFVEREDGADQRMEKNVRDLAYETTRPTLMPSLCSASWSPAWDVWRKESEESHHGSPTSLNGV